MTSRRLSELSSPEAERRIGADSILLCPVGAIEQHGPHLPLGTDLIVVDAFADAVVDDVGDELDVWLLPSIPVSKSNEHAWSAGTLWVGPETALAMMRDIGRSLGTLPARKLVFLNGHGGNSGLLDVACRELRLEFGLETFLAHAALPPDHGGDGAPEEAGQGIHGGVGETSLMLHIRPDLVDLSLAEPAVPTWLTAYPNLRFGGTTSFGWLSNDFASGGVIGDPTLADADRGKAAFEDGVQHLATVLREIAAFRFPEAMPEPRNSQS
ncbi:creatinine amidohydrolase [Ilumatobacter fluminis]|uniref:Creatinine amidohydrolase n=1 Tax=Ilumatobacter fluminis TaxID=467091 RepID=A0A4V3EJE0_9ACTN|nr:creatininase family protein [Ilumatobacter fluminis]TDT16888.1 creatinine amidohydrolase [Ilumatobacter fluminis]